MTASVRIKIGAYDDSMLDWCNERKVRAYVERVPMVVKKHWDIVVYLVFFSDDDAVAFKLAHFDEVD